MRPARLAAIALTALLLPCCSSAGQGSPAPAPHASAGPTALTSRAPAAPPVASPPASDPAAPAPRTTGNAAESVKFAAAGDFGFDEGAARMLEAMACRDPLFGLALGDLSYGLPGTESGWCSFVTDHLGPDIPLQLVAGNHESDGRNGSIDEFARCLPPRLPGVHGAYGRQWFVDIPQRDPLLRLILISPGLEFPGSGRWDYLPGTDHYRWTAAAIDSARAADIPWVVVGSHKPCHSAGRYECDPGPAVTDLLLDKKVDLVLHGHEHLYQRTHQLALGPDCPSLLPAHSDDACISDTDADFESGAGTVFATVGTGGQPLRDINGSDAEAPYFAASSGANADPTHGFVEIEVTEDSLKATFVGAGGGNFTDSFTLGKP